MINIIGGGPIGAYTAYLLAKSKEEVRIFEEHSKIGEIVQCAGIVSRNLLELVDVNKRFVVNEIKGARIFSPSGNCFEIGNRLNAFILDRKEFDSYLVDRAISEGVEIFLKHRFLGFKNGKLKFRDRSYNGDIVIGADGVLSNVARSAGIFGSRRFFYSTQARVRLERDENFVELYLNDRFRGGFGWLVPEGNKICRIGFMLDRRFEKNLFEDFLKKFDGKVVDRQGGLIPIYDKNIKIERGNVFLVGDAAGQVKATTGGGIIMGLSSSRVLVESLLNKKNYSKEFNKKIGKELRLNLLIRNRLNRFDNKKYDKIIGLLREDKVKGYLNRKGDMDFPSKFVFKLLIKEPRLLQFLL